MNQEYMPFVDNNEGAVCPLGGWILYGAYVGSPEVARSSDLGFRGATFAGSMKISSKSDAFLDLRTGDEYGEGYPVDGPRILTANGVNIEKAPASEDYDCPEIRFEDLKARDLRRIFGSSIDDAIRPTADELQMLVDNGLPSGLDMDLTYLP